MEKPSKQKVWQAIAFVACAGVLWIHLDDLGASEFSGGRITGKIFAMASIGSMLFLFALVLTIFLPRVAATVALAAGLLCLPLYLYVVLPGPYREIFKGEYSVPLQRSFVWNTWAVSGIATLIFAGLFSIRGLSWRGTPEESVIDT